MNMQVHEVLTLNVQVLSRYMFNLKQRKIRKCFTCMWESLGTRLPTAVLDLQNLICLSRRGLFKPTNPPPPPQPTNLYSTNKMSDWLFWTKLSWFRKCHHLDWVKFNSKYRTLTTSLLYYVLVHIYTYICILCIGYTVIVVKLEAMHLFAAGSRCVTYSPQREISLCLWAHSRRKTALKSSWNWKIKSLGKYILGIICSPRANVARHHKIVMCQFSKCKLSAHCYICENYTDWCLNSIMQWTWQLVFL